MLDTRLITAIETTLFEFEEWAMIKPLWQKLSLNELKGIFTEKLKRNVKTTLYEPGNVFNPSLLGDFRVEEGRICSIKFVQQAYCPSASKSFITDGNECLSQIWAKGRAFHKPFEASIEGAIKGIKEFKILQFL